MENTSNNKGWSYSTDEEQLAAHIIGLEIIALNKCAKKTRGIRDCFIEYKMAILLAG